MSDNPLYAELDRLRIELAASKAVVARLEEQRAKAEERAREIEADCAGMRRALRAWRAWCLDERHSVADDTQLFEAAIELMDDALDTLDAKDERIEELEEALKEIMAGKWTESGDKLGAAFSEIRAMQLARKALGEKGDGR